MAEIDLRGVGKRFRDGTYAVRDATFTIGDGEFFILVGPSGCGKSTLLNMIVGLEDVTDGEIAVDGEVVNGVDPKDRGMAMVFQSYAIYPHMTVRENMAFPLRMAKLDRAEIDRRVDEAAAMLELDELLDRKPANLSGGQRQRVAMGRAIVRKPVAFLMDEPLSNLDAKLRVQMRSQLASLQDRLGTTTVYVTHDQVEAMTLGDRVAVLRRGAVQQVATPRDLYLDPANLFVAGFIGSPAMNFLPGRVEGDHLTMPLADVDLPTEVTERWTGHDGPVVVGIRPENIEDVEHVNPTVVDSGITFRRQIEGLEWLGAEIDVAFDAGGSEGGGPGGVDLDRLVEELETTTDAGGDAGRVVARIDRSSGLRVGDEAELWLDTRMIHLFDPDSGECLTRRRSIDLREGATAGTLSGQA